MTLYLYPHQEQGARFLAERERAYLADDMGLGKSAQALVAAQMVGARSILVIAPASTLPNWEREMELWGPWGPNLTFTAISYSSQRKLATAAETTWDVVIMDEAHYVKNPKAKRTRAALAVAKQARHVWLLSGTPMPNHPGELYAPMKALWPHVLTQLGIGSYQSWIDRFCQYKMVSFGRGRPQPKIFGAKNLDQLKPHMRDVLLRRRLMDVALDMPPLRVDTHRLPADSGFEKHLGPDAQQLLAAIQAEDTAPDGSAAKLRRLMGEYKAPRIAFEVGKELEDGAYPKIVLLAYHHAALDTLERELKDFNPVGFRGSTTTEKRQEAIDRFTNDPTCRVFIAQQTAAGVGINLQVASEIVLVEPAWSPDDNAQAIKRIHRIGQDAPCRARIFTVAGSLDEAIMGTLQRKLRMQRDLGLK
jgi:SNF2 family DNA or RNA helicase